MLRGYWQTCVKSEGVVSSSRVIARTDVATTVPVFAIKKLSPHDARSIIGNLHLAAFEWFLRSRLIRARRFALACDLDFIARSMFVVCPTILDRPTGSKFECECLRPRSAPELDELNALDNIIIVGQPSVILTFNPRISAD
jgi:hypothetical protein